MSSTTERSGRRRHTARTHTAEDQALNQIAKEAESRLAAKRAERAQAREIRMKELERLQKETEEKSDRVYKSSGTEVKSSGVSAKSRTVKDDSVEGTRDLKSQLYELEEKFKKAMMNTALLDNEKQALIYQVDLLKDKLDDQEEQLTELTREHKDKCRLFQAHKRNFADLERDFNGLKEQLLQRDKLIKDHGLVIVGSESGELTLAKNPDCNGPVIQLGAALVSPEAAKILEEAGDGSLGTIPVLCGMPEHDQVLEKSPLSPLNTSDTVHVSGRLLDDASFETSFHSTDSTKKEANQVTELVKDETVESIKSGNSGENPSEISSSQQENTTNTTIISNVEVESEGSELESEGIASDVLLSKSKGDRGVDDVKNEGHDDRGVDDVKNEGHDDRGVDDVKNEGNDVSVGSSVDMSSSGDVGSPVDIETFPDTPPVPENVRETLNTSLTSESTSTEADSDSDIFMDAVEENHASEVLLSNADNVTKDGSSTDNLIPEIIVSTEDTKSQEEDPEQLLGDEQSYPDRSDVDQESPKAEELLKVNDDGKEKFMSVSEEPLDEELESSNEIQGDAQKTSDAKKEEQKSVSNESFTKESSGEVSGEMPDEESFSKKDKPVSDSYSSDNSEHNAEDDDDMKINQSAGTDEHKQQSTKSDDVVSEQDTDKNSNNQVGSLDNTRPELITENKNDSGREASGTQVALLSEDDNILMLGEKSDIIEDNDTSDEDTQGSLFALAGEQFHEKPDNEESDGEMSNDEVCSNPDTEESEVEVDSDDEEIICNSSSVLILDRPELDHEPSGEAHLAEAYKDAESSGAVDKVEEDTSLTADQESETSEIKETASTPLKNDEDEENLSESQSESEKQTLGDESDKCGEEQKQDKTGEEIEQKPADGTETHEGEVEETLSSSVVDVNSEAQEKTTGSSQAAIDVLSQLSHNPDNSSSSLTDDCTSKDDPAVSEESVDVECLSPSRRRSSYQAANEQDSSDETLNSDNQSRDNKNSEASEIFEGIQDLTEGLSKELETDKVEKDPSGIADNVSNNISEDSNDRMAEKNNLTEDSKEVSPVPAIDSLEEENNLPEDSKEVSDASAPDSLVETNNLSEDTKQESDASAPDSLVETNNLSEDTKEVSDATAIDSIVETNNLPEVTKEGLSHEQGDDMEAGDVGATGGDVDDLNEDSEAEDGSEYTLDDIDLDEDSEKLSDLASLDSGTASKENLNKDIDTEGSDLAQSPTQSDPGVPPDSDLSAGTQMKGSVSKDSVLSEGRSSQKTGTKVKEGGKGKSRQKGRGGGRPKKVPTDLGLPLALAEPSKEDIPVPLERKKRSRKNKQERPQSHELEVEEEHAKTHDNKGHKSGSKFFKKIFGRT